jgi:hypothetical protein
MGNPNPPKENLKPFKKGKDPRRNTTGQNKGSFSLTRAVKEYLLQQAKDGETYGDKLKKAAVLRAITKSDVLTKEIWDRMDGKVVQPTDITSGGKPIPLFDNVTVNKNGIRNNDSDAKDTPTP